MSLRIVYLTKNTISLSELFVRACIICWIKRKMVPLRACIPRVNIIKGIYVPNDTTSFMSTGKNEISLRDNSENSSCRRFSMIFRRHCDWWESTIAFGNTQLSWTSYCATEKANLWKLGSHFAIRRLIYKSRSFFFFARLRAIFHAIRDSTHALRPWSSSEAKRFFRNGADFYLYIFYLLKDVFADNIHQ